jgi:hypothetical protein
MGDVNAQGSVNMRGDKIGTRWPTLAAVVLMLLAGLAVSAGTACAEGADAGSAEFTKEGRPGPDGAAFTMNQTISDEAQENTIAFDALAFLTGNEGADSFFPPGKVADLWGFQYLRDNDRSGMGHNTDFLTKAANNMLYILTDEQKAALASLAGSQVADIEEYALERFTLIDAFRALLSGDVPEGSDGLSLDAVMEYSAGLYMLDGEMCIERAEVMGGILSSLNEEQRAYLDALKGKGMLEWPDVGDQLDKRQFSHDEHVAVMTYAGDLFSWYMGSVEADVYFCPERQGTYFGSFYLKDAPAVGNANYTIDETITGNSGAAFLDILSEGQAGIITGLVDQQKAWLLEIVQLRQSVAEQLRLFINGEDADEDSVLHYMERYGELDGIIVYSYATAFAAVNETLTDEQRSQLEELRSALGVSVPQGAYMYAEPIGMPTAVDSDFLFEAAQEPAAIEADAPGVDGVLVAIAVLVLAGMLVTTLLVIRGRK